MTPSVAPDTTAERLIAEQVLGDLRSAECAVLGLRADIDDRCDGIAAGIRALIARTERTLAALLAAPAGSEEVQRAALAAEAGEGGDRSSASPSPAPSQQAEQDAPSVVLTPAEVYALLPSTSWPERWWPVVVAIAQCESGLDAAEVGDGGRSVGLLQGFEVHLGRVIGRASGVRRKSTAPVRPWAGETGATCSGLPTKCATSEDVEV